MQPNRIRKSIGAEQSYEPDLNDAARIVSELEVIAATLKQRMESQQASGRTLTLKLKYADYQQVTRSKTLLHPIDDLDGILGLAAELLATLEVEQKPVRLLGLSLSNLSGETDTEFVQMSLNFPHIV